MRINQREIKYKNISIVPIFNTPPQAEAYMSHMPSLLQYRPHRPKEKFFLKKKPLKFNHKKIK